LRALPLTENPRGSEAGEGELSYVMEKHYR